MEKSQWPSPKMNPRGPSQLTSGKIIKGRSPGFQAWTLGGIVGIMPHIHGIRTSYGRWSMFQGKATGDHGAVGLCGEEKVLLTSNPTSVQIWPLNFNSQRC